MALPILPSVIFFAVDFLCRLSLVTATPLILSNREMDDGSDAEGGSLSHQVLTAIVIALALSIIVVFIFICFWSKRCFQSFFRRSSKNRVPSPGAGRRAQGRNRSDFVTYQMTQLEPSPGANSSVTFLPRYEGIRLPEYSLPEGRLPPGYSALAQPPKAHTAMGLAEGDDTLS
jgi:hypothetical protein